MKKLKSPILTALHFYPRELLRRRGVFEFVIVLLMTVLHSWESGVFKKKAPGASTLPALFAPLLHWVESQSTITFAHSFTRAFVLN